MRGAAGFTLLELLSVLTVAGILLGIAVPSFQTVVLDSRRTSDVNGFVLAVQIARSEAAKRSHSVILCKTADRRRCGGEELGFDAGWMVFANVDGEMPPERSAAEPMIYAYVPVLQGTIVANRPYFEFRPLLRRSTNGTVVFCDRRGTPAARAVIVSYTGRPRVDQVDPDGKPLACAGLS